MNNRKPGRWRRWIRPPRDSARNGSPGHSILPPRNHRHGKGTLYEGGINVPLIVSGPVVKAPGREVKALVDSVDMFPTIAELSGINARQVVPKSIPIDGISFVPYLKNPLQTHTSPASTPVSSICPAAVENWPPISNSLMRLCWRLRF